MATGMHMDERSIDCFVLGHHDQDRKVSANSVTMRAMTLCKNLSGYRELLLTYRKKKTFFFLSALPRDQTNPFRPVEKMVKKMVTKNNPPLNPKVLPLI